MFKEYCFDNDKVIINLSDVVYVSLYKLSDMYRLEINFGHYNDCFIYEDVYITKLSCLYEEIKKDLPR